MNIGIIISRFNEQITQGLLHSCMEVLEKKDIEVKTVWVPGAFEIPYAAKMAAKSEQFDAIICLGAVIRGETPHFDYVAQEVASGVSRVSYDFEIPVIFGVLTTDTVEQAKKRVDSKGKYAADACLEMLHLPSFFFISSKCL